MRHLVPRIRYEELWLNEIFKCDIKLPCQIFFSSCFTCLISLSKRSNSLIFVNLFLQEKMSKNGSRC